MIKRLESSLWRILVAWVAAWPTLTLVLYALQPFSADWPVPLRALASATGMALLMNLVSVPIVKRVFAWTGRSPEAGPEPSPARTTAMAGD